MAQACRILLYKLTARLWCFILCVKTLGAKEGSFKEDMHLTLLKSRGFFSWNFEEIPSQCSRTPSLSITSSDCHISARVFREEHSNHAFVMSQTKGLTLSVPAELRRARGGGGKGIALDLKGFPFAGPSGSRFPLCRGAQPGVADNDVSGATLCCRIFSGYQDMKA